MKHPTGCRRHSLSATLYANQRLLLMNVCIKCYANFMMGVWEEWSYLTIGIDSGISDCRKDKIGGSNWKYITRKKRERRKFSLRIHMRFSFNNILSIAIDIQNRHHNHSLSTTRQILTDPSTQHLTFLQRFPPQILQLLRLLVLLHRDMRRNLWLQRHWMNAVFMEAFVHDLRYFQEFGHCLLRDKDVDGG